MKKFDAEIFADERYFSMLALIAGLSKLFSDSQIPFIHYRITENLFCRYLGAENLARTDTAYDAKLKDIGIGIKTFIMQSNFSSEKIAEFNSLAPELKNIDGLDLAYKLADFRNQRINVANRIFGINSSLYHIISRKKECLFVFNTPYDFIDKDNIKILKTNKSSLHFTDGKNKYSFNRSKTVLLKEFFLPPEAHKIDVKIIENPFILLERLLSEESKFGVYQPSQQILLPLFSVKNGKKYVPLKSGLNQWNAAGRKRDENEVYVPIPANVRAEYKDFFPSRETVFTLKLPNGEIMKAKVCQENGKALMSNPNSALGEWLLRKILHIKPGEIVTYEDLILAGFDSLLITKESPLVFKLEVSVDKSFDYS